MVRAPETLLDIVEAAYRFEQPADAWLQGVLTAARPALDRGGGVSAFLYDASDERALKVWSLIGGVGPTDVITSAIEASTPAHVIASFRSRACGQGSDSPVWHEQPAAKLFARYGLGDRAYLNGLDPSGIGCFLSAAVPTGDALGVGERRLWTRLAHHLAAGFRLQRRLAAGKPREADVEAILTPGGKAEHVTGDACSTVEREALRSAVRAVERSRGRLRRDDPEAAVSGWRGLVAARWSLVDFFDSDGKRYVVARRNEAACPAPPLLTPRERQVIAYARMGHSNKLVAYALGISASTVGVLLSRAARKLGARNRAELFAAVDALDRAR